MRLFATFYLLASASCAGEPNEPAVIVPLSGIGAPLEFNGQTAVFGFDTGAGAHTVASWFVHAAELPVDSSFAGLTAMDATGSPVQLTVVHGLLGRYGAGTTLPIGTAVVAAFPPSFESDRIGGLINPQLLATDADAAVLDLRVPELRIEPFDQAVQRLDARVLAEHEFETCVSTDVAIPNLTYAIAVLIEGAEGWLGLDTGADATTINNPSLVRGRVLEPGGRSIGVGGRAQEYNLARELTVTFAGHTVTMDARVVEATGGDCGEDGRLGLDALGQCALVLGDGAVAIACSR